MKYDPVEYQDRSGRTVVVRNAVASDAEALIRLLKDTAAETGYLMRDPDEVTYTAEQETAFIEDRLNAENELLLTVTCEGVNVGLCTFYPVGSFRRYVHRCVIGIVLYQEFCGTGIGSILLEAVLNKAREAGYEQAELEVVSENKRAVALYEKFGFVKYGTHPDNMKYSDGTYASTDWMMKKL